MSRPTRQPDRSAALLSSRRAFCRQAAAGALFGAARYQWPRPSRAIPKSRPSS